MKLMTWLASAALFAGCTNHPSLQKAMKDFDFVAITPPQSDWEPGSVIEIAHSGDESPVLRLTPTLAGARITILDSLAPDISTSHESKLDVALGTSIAIKNVEVQAKLTALGVSQYSVVARGNVIRRVLIDVYRKESFPTIAAYSKHFWAVPLRDGKLNFIYEAWFAAELEYRFYDKSGAAVEVKLTKPVPVDLKAELSSQDGGTLVYKAKDGELICLGYKCRPIVQEEDGEIHPQGTGVATLDLPPARSDLWVEKK